MTQFPHDQFIKDYLPQLLEDYGVATAAMEVATEVKEIDVLFIPNQPAPREILGLLGQLAEKPCLFEVFRNSVTSEQIFSCVSKLFDFQRAKVKESQKNKQPLTETELPQLWILTPTLSQNILELRSASPQSEQWSKGVYLLPFGFRTGIVVIHQLPATPSTLWLRVLGKGMVNKKLSMSWKVYRWDILTRKLF